MAGTSNLSAIGLVNQRALAAFVAASILTAGGVTTKRGAVDLNGTSALTVSGVRILQALVAMASTSSFTVTIKSKRVYVRDPDTGDVVACVVWARDAYFLPWKKATVHVRRLSDPTQWVTFS